MLETVWKNRWLPDLIKTLNGGIAQLGEHLPCKQGVKGSNPFISTVIRKRMTNKEAPDGAQKETPDGV